MFKKIISILLMISFAFPAQAQMLDATDGQFFFRYKAGLPEQAQLPEDDWASKTINARFIGGVDMAFSEVLPVKPEWEDDSWQVDVGTLPVGITFNKATRTFEGRPQNLESGVNVILFGYDSSGNRVAKADVTFDIRALPENSVKVDLYAHTSRFFNNTLPLPSGVVIERWDETELPPGGVQYNGRYVEGTPVAKGQWPILNLGYEAGNPTPVFAYYGSLTVEDGPQFAVIEDQLKTVGSFFGAAIWDAWQVPSVKRAVGDPARVRYYVERASGQAWPGTLRSSGDEFTRLVSGRVSNYFDQTSIRIKAIDSDGAEGYSNWFKIGSLGPEGVCVPGEKPTIELSGVVDKPLYNTGYRIPTARDASTKEFTVVSGALPQALTLDKDTGIIAGVPKKEEKALGIMVAINFPQNPTATTVMCGPYDIVIAPAEIKLEVLEAKDDYRIEETLNATVTPSGGLIAPYSVQMNAGAVLPANVTFDAATGKLTGKLDTVGRYVATFVLTNGDGVKTSASVSFEVHDKLTVDPVPTEVSIARLDRKELFAFTYDTKAVIGTAVWDVVNGPMPEGIRLQGGKLVVEGGTFVVEGRYGPFKLRLTDDTAENVSTNDFWINVTPREPLEEGPTVPPVFGVNTSDSLMPFSVTQAPLAQNFYDLQYSLVGPNDLPGTLVFKPETGEIVGTPTKKETIQGFQVVITEQSPERLTATSDTFDVVINDPPPIGEISAKYILRGNKDGPSIQSNPLKNYIGTAAKRLVGGVDKVKFLSYSPVIPGLSIDTASGVLKGAPTAEFNDIITVVFEDEAQRQGALKFRVTVYPYPQLQADTYYDLARLEDSTFVVTPNLGYYGGITWAVDPTSDQLPLGLVFAGGALTGSTDAAVGTVKNIVFSGTHNANGIKVTHSFSLEITNRKPTTFEFPDKKFTVYLNGDTGEVALRDTLRSADFIKGSYVKPMVYSLKPGTFPSWMTIDPVTGQIGGKPPGVGDWSPVVVATDKELVVTEGSPQVRASLAGYVVATPGTVSMTVRQGETFKTPDQVVSNVVKPFQWLPSNQMPSTFSLLAANGNIVGRYDAPGSDSFTVDIEDAHERGPSGPYTFKFQVERPLDLRAPTSNEPSRQYSPTERMLVQFDVPANKIGDIAYTVTGDIPGTLYVKTLLNATTARYTKYDNDGNRLAVVDQLATETASQTENRLEADSLIFDSETLQLRGMPSRDGTFELTLHAWDRHGERYYEQSDANRVEYNSDKQSFSVTVQPALDFAVATNLQSELLHEYTTQATVRSSVVNNAYGRPVTWKRLSGSLPANVAAAQGATSLSYRGYPESQGTYANIVWEAVDAAGRRVETDPVSLVVGPRLSLELASTKKTPVQMVVFEDDAATVITAKNAAYGPVIGAANWTVTGQQNLPPNVYISIADDSVSFTGISDKIGVYSGIQITATDRLGATATYDLTFRVVSSPFPIILNVFDIKTKIGFPIAMEPPFASRILSTDNTYGKLRFYSDDLPQDILLDQDTGLIAGVVDNPGKLNFDIYVTDDTQRVTSEALEIDVMPRLRVLVPSEVRVEPGMVMDQPVATDYQIGTVVYSKGPGNWPTNFEVDPATGRIYSKSSGGKVTANLGTYAGLTIVATDTITSPTFGVLEDTQSSNPFSIVIATAGSYLELKTAVLPDAEKRIKAYSFDFMPHLLRQNVEQEEVVWTLINDSTRGWRIPPGITMSNGVISGTPTLEGEYTFGVKATLRTNAGITSTMPYTLKVNLPLLELALDGKTFDKMKRNDAFNFDMKTLISKNTNIPMADIRFTKTTVPNGKATNGPVMSNLGVWSGAWKDIGLYEFDIEAKYVNGNEEAKVTTRYSILVEGESFKFKELSGGIVHTCGINSDDELQCWGGAGNMRLGYDAPSNQPTPKTVDFAKFKKVAAGQNHGCGITANDEVACWGHNGSGQLGNGTTTTSGGSLPAIVPLPGPATAIEVSTNHSCAVVSGTDLYCWGRNVNGELGDGTKTAQLTPVLGVSVPQGIRNVHLAPSKTCYSRNDGVAFCIGSNGFAQLGTGNTSVVTGWAQVSVASNIKKIVGDQYTTCVMRADGSAQCWGRGDDYRLGNGADSSTQRTAVSVRNVGSNVVDIDYGNGFGCAALTDGAVSCWGVAGSGEMGTGGSSNGILPTKTSTLNLAVKVEVGGDHACAITFDGSAECWGLGSAGQLGNGTFANKNVPTKVE